MERTYQWSEEELFRAYQLEKKIPGVITWKYYLQPAILSLCLIYVIIRLLPLRLWETVYVFLAADLTEKLKLGFYFVLVILWMGYLLFMIFFYRKWRLRRNIRKNRDHLLIPRVIRITEEAFRETDADASGEWFFHPWTSICFIGEFVYGVERDQKSPRICWAFPRRILGSTEEEQRFRNLVRGLCTIEDIEVR